MPDYNRVVISGTLGGGLEIFSTACNFIPDVGPTVQSPTDLNAWAAAIVAGPLDVLPAGIANGLGTGSLITEVSCYFYADIGNPAISVGTAPCNEPGSGSATCPLSTAAVATLRTDLAGRRYRGRMYWPAMGWDCTTGGHFAPASYGTMADDVAELLEGIAAAAGGTYDLRPAVVSVAGGFVTPVTSITVDNVPDTQRRRDENLVPTTTTSPYPPV